MDFKQNFFELFDLPVSARINQSQLDTRYRELQRTVHPDRFASATQHEQRLALQYTTLINEAYETLGSDLKRCIYLLELRGIEITDTENTEVEPMFLMQQIELREALDDITQQEDPIKELKNMRIKVESILASLLDDLVDTLAAESEATLEQATPVIRKMQYMTKLENEIDFQEEELLDY